MKLLLQILKNKIDNYILVHWDKMLDRPNIKNGLIEVSDKQIKKNKDYVYGKLGSTNSKTIKKDGNFEKFIPVGEQQNKPFEKMFCVSENGACNSIEANFNYFIHLVNNGEANEKIQEFVKIFKYFGLIKGDKCLLDTEYVASGSGTTRRGNSFNSVAGFIRNYGLIPKGDYPKYATWNELYYPNGGIYINGNKVPPRLLEQGKKLCEYIDFTYEWVSPYNMDSVMEKGVLGTSVFAWHYPNADGIYQRVNLNKNHAVYKFKKSEKEFKTIGDSYQPFVKKLALNYSLGNGMLISFGLKKKFSVFNEKEIINFKDKRKVDYVLLVENYKNFTPGMYKIENSSLNKIETPTAVNDWIKQLSKEGRLIGINGKDFSKFLT